MTAVALRAIVMLLLIPGTVIVYIPLRILGRDNLFPRAEGALGVVAALFIIAGLFVLLRCVWDFFAAGHGTLAPFDPPRRLVVRGLYRYTRNPMYNAVLAVLLGEALLFRSTDILTFAGVMLLIFTAVVMVYEEPALEARFGDSYRSYRAAVPRWGFTRRRFGGW